MYLTIKFEYTVFFGQHNLKKVHTSDRFYLHCAAQSVKMYYMKSFQYIEEKSFILRILIGK